MSRTEIIDYDKFTVRELRKMTRAKIREINTTITEYETDVEMGMWDRSEVYENEINIINTRFSKGSTGRYGGLSAKDIERKTKKQLIEQLTDLERFEKWDVYSPESMDKKEKQWHEVYESFIGNKNNENLTYEEFRQFANVTNAMKEMNENHGYEDVQSAYAEATAEGKKKFIEVIKEVKKLGKGAGWTEQEFTDKVVEYLKSNNLYRK